MCLKPYDRSIKSIHIHPALMSTSVVQAHKYRSIAPTASSGRLMAAGRLYYKDFYSEKRLTLVKMQGLTFPTVRSHCQHFIYSRLISIGTYGHPYSKVFTRLSSLCLSIHFIYQPVAEQQ